ncbi:hypothetical protein A3A93_05585 [Candidatus Roizmanbacteria bacterium RIFCSPLOWO2_01_FULL_38_12]|uniref:Uncharacterized protein n=1 Tax=Candidatus Roizmanbacteria bacterium RIFCSPLOWO2_01_FULL_38_12 TaxID=1802061 RepID=A0A1F7IXT5_9BACT|nr:MAG: hypothetical protein A2861_04605 [Candidatus Roizmanbacteria bacterium RIFCSPHIGHO2_01_FULL_38_15]OGK34989.1 MAG: hypothetical protein A3F59_04685 [Candidatus Roizmanbacteria bacterium RIFCSPHIGHO2_12_FULL_38_13]OGK48180.1 MAG: hypothetical protein A3A93_05585 [Candidatus Roizmanbacteria bacterium RIFCSPLOWO2_01_FULL_38_12]
MNLLKNLFIPISFISILLIIPIFIALLFDSYKIYKKSQGRISGKKIILGWTIWLMMLIIVIVFFHNLNKFILYW